MRHHLRMTQWDGPCAVRGLFADLVRHSGRGTREDEF